MSKLKTTACEGGREVACSCLVSPAGGLPFCCKSLAACDLQAGQAGGSRPAWELPTLPAQPAACPSRCHSDPSLTLEKANPGTKKTNDPILSYLPAGRLAIDYFHNQCPSLDGLKEGENEAEWIVDLTTQASRGQRAVSRGGKGLGRLPKASPVEAAL